MAEFKIVKDSGIDHKLETLGRTSRMRNLMEALLAIDAKNDNQKDSEGWKKVKEEFEKFGFAVVYDRNLAILTAVLFLAIAKSGCQDLITNAKIVINKKAKSSKGKSKGGLVNIGQALLDGDGKAIYEIVGSNLFKQVLKDIGIEQRYVDKYVKRMGKITGWVLKSSKKELETVKQIFEKMTGEEYKIPKQEELDKRPVNPVDKKKPEPAVQSLPQSTHPKVEGLEAEDFEVKGSEVEGPKVEKPIINVDDVNKGRENLRSSAKNTVFVIKGYKMADFSYAAYKYKDKQNAERVAYLPFPKDGHSKAYEIVRKVIDFVSSGSGNKSLFNPFTRGREGESAIESGVKRYLKESGSGIPGMASVDNFFEVISGDPDSGSIVFTKNENELDHYYKEIEEFAGNVADKLLKTKNINFTDDNCFWPKDAEKDGISTLYTGVKGKDTLYVFTIKKQTQGKARDLLISLFLRPEGERQHNKKENVRKLIIRSTKSGDNYLKELPFDVVDKIEIKDEEVENAKKQRATQEEKEKLKRMNLQMRQQERDKAVKEYTSKLGLEIQEPLNYAINEAWGKEPFSKEKLSERLKTLQTVMGGILTKPALKIPQEIKNMFDVSKTWDFDWQISFFETFAATKPVDMDLSMKENAQKIYSNLPNKECKDIFRFLYFVGHNYAKVAKGKLSKIGEQSLMMTTSALPAPEKQAKLVKDTLIDAQKKLDSWKLADLETSLNYLKSAALKHYGKVDSEYDIVSAHGLMSRYCAEKLPKEKGDKNKYEEIFEQIFGKYRALKKEKEEKAAEEALASDLNWLNPKMGRAQNFSDFAKTLRPILSKIAHQCISEEIQDDNEIFPVGLKLLEFMNKGENKDNKYKEPFDKIWEKYGTLYKADLKVTIDKMLGEMIPITPVENIENTGYSLYIFRAKWLLINTLHYNDKLEWNIGDSISDEDLDELCNDNKGSLKHYKDEFKKIYEWWKALKRAEAKLMEDDEWA
ncbi:MAG: hypothetical protein Q4D57_03695 [Clostridia bacterium]|nr:hypothetical protein [Clostridia bacterium]